MDNHLDVVFSIRSTDYDWRVCGSGRRRVLQLILSSFVTSPFISSATDWDRKRADEAWREKKKRGEMRVAPFWSSAHAWRPRGGCSSRWSAGRIPQGCIRTGVTGRHPGIPVPRGRTDPVLPPLSLLCKVSQWKFDDRRQRAGWLVVPVQWSCFVGRHGASDGTYPASS